MVGWKIEREIERTAALHKEKMRVDKPINPFSLFIWKWIGETLCGRSQVSLNPRWKHKNGKKSAAASTKNIPAIFYFNETTSSFDDVISLHCHRMKFSFG